MKNIQSFEEFLNEKAYQLQYSYGAKGIWGKVLFAFKKQIERIQFENEVQILEEVNEEWLKFTKKDAIKIIKDEVLKHVKTEESLIGITANLNDTWVTDALVQSDTIRVKYAHDCVINVTFADDVNGNKFKNKLGGYVNTPLHNANVDVTILGEPANEPNNVEIRSRLYLHIDVK